MIDMGMFSKEYVDVEPSYFPSISNKLNYLAGDVEDKSVSTDRAKREVRYAVASAFSKISYEKSNKRRRSEIRNVNKISSKIQKLNTRGSIKNNIKKLSDAIYDFY